VPDWRDLLDAIAPGLALGGAFGWLGCLLTGAGYGAEAAGYGPPLSWLTADLPDIYGVYRIRFLAQALMMGWSLALWGILARLRTSSFAGRRLCLPRGGAFVAYLLLYALGNLCVMFLRGDGTWRSGLWLSQWADIVQASAAIGLGAYTWTRQDGPSALTQ
jgi:prolipoprotein diacylglyceryltransferase